MSGSFASQYAVNAAAGFDASQLKGRSVIVTGGASGLGEEMVRQFVEAGAFVTIGDLSEENGKKAVSHYGEDRVAFVRTDVLTWSDQVSLFKTAIAKSPSKQVNVICANAGISGADTVWRDDTSGAQDDEPIEPDLKILNINLIGVMYTVKLAVHYLARNPEGSDRCLIMTSSLAGYLDQPGSPQYCSSKWGVRGIMRSMRRTMTGAGMRVNVIAPWFVETPIMSQQVRTLLAERGVKYAAKEDVAAAVLHMASDRSINGRACAILPRSEVKTGYIDIQQDNDAEEDILAGLQGIVMTASHRIGTK